MPQTLVLDPSSDTDTSSVVRVRRDDRNLDKLTSSKTSAVGLPADVYKPGHFYQNEVVISRDSLINDRTSATARVKFGAQELWPDINDYLTAHFLAANVLEVTLRNEPLDPNISQAQVAHEFIANLRNLITRRALTWHEPAVSHDEHSDAIEISWWRANKSLIVAVEPGNPITFLKVWGPHIYDDMEEGERPSGDQLVALWQWLYP